MINAYSEFRHKYISVADNGIGVEPAKQEQIFIPFFSTKEKGSSIGLSLSKQIMKKHGGDLTIRSIPNEGATFTLEFSKWLVNFIETFKKTALSFTIFLLVLFLFFNFILEGLVKNKLQQLVADTFGSYYELTFDNNVTSLALSGFSIGFTGVVVKSDTTNAQLMSKFSPVFFNAQELAVQGVSIQSLLFNQILILMN